MTIWARAPARIDLAGGPLDIWPLYLFLDYAVTVNVSVSLSSQAWVVPGSANGYRLVSEDSRLEEQADSIEDLDLSGPLGLLARAVRHFRPDPGLTVATFNDAPRGSGLGSSSSLLLAVLAALQTLTGRAPDTTELVNLAADLEAQVIQIPTGKQDYYAAIHGGANAIWFEPGRIRVEELPMTPVFAARLREVVILSFTGQARLSAPTNWEVVKSFIDGHPGARARLERIRRTALKMREAWLSEDIEALGRLVAEEWDNRRELAAGVSTPAVEKAMAVAQGAGALASKICGAGGGGCMVTVARRGRKDEIVAALKNEEIAVLDFDFEPQGLVVRQEGYPLLT